MRCPGAFFVTALVASQLRGSLSLEFSIQRAYFLSLISYILSNTLKETTAFNSRNSFVRQISLLEVHLRTTPTFSNARQSTT